MLVPEGWRVTEQGVMGPGGEEFRSRQEALVSLLEAGGREEEVDVMRQCLHHEDWCDDPYLPFR